MLRYSLFIGIVLLNQLLSSCQKFQENFEAVAIRCGVEPNTIDRNRKAYALILESGERPTDLILSGVKARFVDPEKNIEPLHVTPKGCLLAPNETGLIQVLAPDAGLHIAAPVTADASRDAAELVLRKKISVDIQLLCPKDGLHSQGDLNSPLQINAQGSLESIEVQLQAGNLLLLDKPYGLSELTQPANLLPPSLPEGVYPLKLSYRNSMEAWDQELSSQAECPLYIQRKPPEVQGLSYARGITNQPFAVKKGERLPWYAESPIRYELRFCREELAADEDLLPTLPVACAPSSRCLDEKNFEPIEQKRTDTTGLFHYFVYAEDRAGNRSPTFCERLAVSDSAPRLDVSWKNPSWNIPLSVMEYAAVDVEAVAAVSHPELSDARLLQDLECKVDFRVNGQLTLPGKDVICTGESCAGQTLGDYRKCGPNIRFSLSQFWANQKAQRMEMRVHVRSSDQAGQVEEATRSLWIYPERFMPLPMALPEHVPSAIYRARDDQIFVMASPGFYRWNEGSQNWDSAELPTPTDVSRLWSVQDKSRDIFVVWKSAESHGAAVWKEGKWEQIADDPVLESCRFEMRAHHASGFWCQGLTGDARLWQNEQWQRLDHPKSCRITTVAGHQSEVISCHEGPIYQRQADGTWEALPRSPVSQNDIVLDYKKRVWVLGRALPDSTLWDGVAFFENGSWRLVEARPRLTPLRAYSTLQLDEHGLVTYNDATWDESTQNWIRSDRLIKAFPDSATTAMGDAHFTSHGFGFWTASDTFHYFPLGSFSITAFDRKIITDGKGRRWFLTLPNTEGKRSIHRIDPVAWHSYREEAGIKDGQTYSQVTSFRFNTEGLPEFLFSHGGLMRGTSDQGWLKAFPDTIGDGSVLAETLVDGQGRTYGHNWRRLYAITAEGSFKLLHTFPSTPEFALYPDVQGRIWAHATGSRDVWILDGDAMIPVPLPENFKVEVNIRWYFLPDRILVSNGGNFLRWNETTRTWEERSWMEERLPGTSRFLRQVGPDHLLTQASSGSPLRLYTNNGRDLEIIPKPPADAQNGRYHYTRLGLMFLSFGKGVHVYRDKKWVTLLTPEEIRPRMESDEPVGFLDLALDPYQRLWVQGSNFKLLRLDLNLD
ncbi:hypothetical protein [Oligoflexus tunisiensis]|uniref:hypothetical protein n=1 Tax=Oligoflexus tunisiensis TaxID=708132 RepID=UPI00114CEFE0|nr:hypothetical protein [Oligoflexus tunisiensis]